MVTIEIINIPDNEAERQSLKQDYILHTNDKNKCMHFNVFSNPRIISSKTLLDSKNPETLQYSSIF